MCTYREYLKFAETYPSARCEIQYGVPWVKMQARRIGQTLEIFSRHRAAIGSGPVKILDVGAYPGTLLKLLRLYLNETGFMAGVGLEGPEDFTADLAAHGIEFLAVNLDPLVNDPDPHIQALPQAIPYPDAHFQVVFCTELLEHLLDPLHVLREMRRVIATEGILVLTTPNQAKISNRLKLLCMGRSINYPINDSIMFNLTRWRPHIREYTLDELGLLLASAGWRMLESHYLDTAADDLRLHSGSQLPLRVLKSLLGAASIIPALRHDMLVVGQPAASRS